nr:MAG TPA: hypothetical protein [Caudoviricetes sp.]
MSVVGIVSYYLYYAYGISMQFKICRFFVYIS